MPMNRREFVAGAVAGAAVLQREMKGFAVPEGIIQVRIDASVSRRADQSNDFWRLYGTGDDASVGRDPDR